MQMGIIELYLLHTAVVVIEEIMYLGTVPDLTGNMQNSLALCFLVWKNGGKTYIP